jgi:hypothetical protein
MDTTKLVVGQKVWMRSGDLRREVVVTDITEGTETTKGYIDVEPVFAPLSERPWMARFDREGIMRSPFLSWDWGGFGFYEWYPAFGGWWQEDARSATDFGLWELASNDPS